MRFHSKPKKIKLIIADLYGVISQGSYRNICRWIAKKYKIPFGKVYDVVYHKYFSAAALGKITEQQSFEEAIAELNLKENWKQLRSRHMAFLKPNKSNLRLFLDLQTKGFKVLILSKNTKWQFNNTVKQQELKKHFKNIINTVDLGIPKASKQTMRYVMKKFKVKKHELIFIDDQDFNLPPARSMGIKTILYKNHRQLKKALNQLLK